MITVTSGKGGVGNTTATANLAAGIERGFRNAIAPADIVLVITNPEVSAVRDADRIICVPH